MLWPPGRRSHEVPGDATLHATHALPRSNPTRATLPNPLVPPADSRRLKDCRRVLLVLPLLLSLLLQLLLFLRV